MAGGVANVTLEPLHPLHAPAACSVFTLTEPEPVMLIDVASVAFDASTQSPPSTAPLPPIDKSLSSESTQALPPFDEATATDRVATTTSSFRNSPDSIGGSVRLITTSMASALPA